VLQGQANVRIVAVVGRGDVDQVHVRVADQFLVRPVRLVETMLSGKGLRPPEVPRRDGVAAHLLHLSQCPRHFAGDVAGAQDPYSHRKRFVSAKIMNFC